MDIVKEFIFILSTLIAAMSVDISKMVTFALNGSSGFYPLSSRFLCNITMQSTLIIFIIITIIPINEMLLNILHALSV